VIGEGLQADYQQKQASPIFRPAMKTEAAPLAR
jgi:hypothetical protein